MQLARKTSKHAFYCESIITKSDLRSMQQFAVEHRCAWSSHDAFCRILLELESCDSMAKRGLVSYDDEEEEESGIIGDAREDRHGRKLFCFCFRSDTQRMYRFAEFRSCGFSRIGAAQHSKISTRAWELAMSHIHRRCDLAPSVLKF